MLKLISPTWTIYSYFLQKKFREICTMYKSDILFSNLPNCKMLSMYDKLLNIDHIHKAASSMSTLTQCWVCLKDLDRPSVHYGGVSCHACRTFFRRTVLRNTAGVCRKGGECHLMSMMSSVCAFCRFNKCLR